MTRFPATLPSDHADRMNRVRLALDGLSVGDAFGDQFFRPEYRGRLDDPDPFVPPGQWPYTDDTEMALGIVDVLDRLGSIVQDELANVFARRFRIDPYRGYGPGAVRLLSSITQGGNWRLEARMLFSGMGSFGNGSAMRVAPVGAYFATDGYATVAEQARLSAEVTHAHPDGIAGGIAIAVAAAYAWEHRARRAEVAVQRGLFDVVLDHTPLGDLRKGIEHAAAVDSELSTRSAAKLLGNGVKVTCSDTVPFCLWSVARNLNNYEAAIWDTIRVGGDVDTTAAIVGGVVALATSETGIPAEWLSQREPLKFDPM